MDVAALMAAIEVMHRTTVVLCLQVSDTSGASFAVSVAVVESGEDASVMGQAVLGISGAWPCKEHTTLQACVFAGLYKLDGEISRQLYKQSELDL